LRTVVKFAFRLVEVIGVVVALLTVASLPRRGGAFAVEGDWR
jgi:hypothetical protein